MKRKLPALLLLTSLLAGCGSEVDWFPEAADTTTNEDSRDVGRLNESIRVSPHDFTITTGKGVFSAYTSLDAPRHTRVDLVTHKDSQTGLTLGQVLRADTKEALVREVLVLVD